GTERLELRRDVLGREAAAARPGGTPLKQVVGQIAKVGVHRRGAHGRQRGCPLLAAERCERRGEQHRDSESTARRHPRAPASGQVPGSKSSCSARSKRLILRVCCKRCRPPPARCAPIWCGSRAVSCFWPRTRLRRGEPSPLAAFTQGEGEITRGIIEYGGLFNFNVARLQGKVVLAPPDTPRRPMTLGEKIIARHWVVDPARGRIGVPAVKPGD